MCLVCRTRIFGKESIIKDKKHYSALSHRISSRDEYWPAAPKNLVYRYHTKSRSYCMGKLKKSLVVGSSGIFVGKEAIFRYWSQRGPHTHTHTHTHTHKNTHMQTKTHTSYEADQINTEQEEKLSKNLWKMMQLHTKDADYTDLRAFFSHRLNKNFPSLTADDN